MTDFGFLPILIDRAKLQRIKLHCKCGTDWIETVPGEVHESSLTIGLSCPKCGAFFTLKNKVFQRLHDGDKPNFMNQNGSWTQSGGGNA